MSSCLDRKTEELNELWAFGKNENFHSSRRFLFIQRLKIFVTTFWQQLFVSFAWKTSENNRFAFKNQLFIYHRHGIEFCHLNESKITVSALLAFSFAVRRKRVCVDVEDSTQTTVRWLTAHCVSRRLVCALSPIDFVVVQALHANVFIVVEWFSEISWSPQMRSYSGKIKFNSILRTAEVNVEICLTDRLGKS